MSLGKGGKSRKKAKNIQIGEKRELAIKEDGQEYGQAIRLVGNGRLEAMCFDGVKRMCTIRGKLKNRVWINSVHIFLVFSTFIIGRYYFDRTERFR